MRKAEEPAPPCLRPEEALSMSGIAVLLLACRSAVRNRRTGCAEVASQPQIKVLSKRDFGMCYSLHQLSPYELRS
jgi:hypothetical protein